MESSTILKQPKGFTLIEMLIVLVIVSILTTIMVLSQSTFNKSLLLTDTAYSVALSAREAQTFGLSSRKYGTANNAGYGLHFDTTNLNKYLIFVDTNSSLALPYGGGCVIGAAGTPEAKPGNCRYDAGQDGLLNNYTFSRGYRIQRFCVNFSGSSANCSDSQPNPLTSLDVVFMRPNTSTVIVPTWTIGGTRSDSMSGAQITLIDAAGVNTKNVCISSLGQVVVTTATCI